MTTILVTGATGTNGKQVALALQEAGMTVRAGVRSVDKAADLAARGVEPVAMDFAAPETLAKAFAGVERVFLLTPFVAQFAPLVEAAVAAAKAAGVQFILRMSALGAAPDSADALSREHGMCEQLVKDSGIAWSVIRPTFFQDNVVNIHGATIKGDGVFYGASGTGKVSYVSSADIAATAAAILTKPADHYGQTYVLTGPEAISDDELAALVGGVLAREIRFVNLSVADYAKSLADNQLPAWMSEHLVALEGYKRNGIAAAVSPAVAQILGRPGESYAAFLARHKAQLTA